MERQRARSKSLSELTADDVMARDIVRLPEQMPLREAARLLLTTPIGGAPVVDAQGRCLGVLSSFDFLRLAQTRAEVAKPAAPLLPVTCSFQTKHRTADGQGVTLCTLAAGVCPIQHKVTGPDGKEMIVCSQPHSVLVDWQVVELEKLPSDEVRAHMTPGPATAAPTTSIRAVARMMIDADVHRVIVVDAERRPLGIVSSIDLLASLAGDDAT